MIYLFYFTFYLILSIVCFNFHIFFDILNIIMAWLFLIPAIIYFILYIKYLKK